jgi:PKD repeat protein
MQSGRGLAQEDLRQTGGEHGSCLQRVRGLATAFCPKTVSALVLTDHKPASCELHTEPIVVKLPRLVGLTKEDALAKIESLKLKAEVVEKKVDGVAVGIVTGQAPAAGAKVKVGTTVTLTVSGGAAADQPPKAAFTAPNSPKAGKAAEFDASPSTDDGSITTYYWEFGDGQTATGKNVKHTWSTPGTYEVTLWVTDDAGQQGSVTKAVSVK